MNFALAVKQTMLIVCLKYRCFDLHLTNLEKINVNKNFKTCFNGFRIPV